MSIIPESLDLIIIELEGFLSRNSLWVVPTLLVVLQFALKVFVGEKASWHQTWINLLQSPVDIGFLALSFTATVLITKTTGTSGLFATSIIFVFLLVVSILLWKNAPCHTTKKSMLTASALVFINYIITGLMLIYSIALVSRG